MLRTFKLTALAAVVVAALPVHHATAQTFAHGDLVLYFQNPGGTTGADQTVYVNLGTAWSDFRGAATGADVADKINFASIGSDLSTAFGANWATETTLYAGLAAAQNNLNPSLGNAINGDSRSTVYVSSPRTAAGTVGTSNSSPGWSTFNGSQVQSAAGGIISMNSTTPAIVGSLATGDAAQFSTSNVFLDEQNVLSPIPLSFNVFAGDVMQQGSAGSFGTLGSVANVEFALDLYRIVAAANRPGQLSGDIVGVPTYEGTMLLDSSGNVSFVTGVPEPSTSLVLLAGLGVFLMRRRRTAAN